MPCALRIGGKSYSFLEIVVSRIDQLRSLVPSVVFRFPAGFFYSVRHLGQRSTWKSSPVPDHDTLAWAQCWVAPHAKQHTISRGLRYCHEIAPCCGIGRRSHESGRRDLRTIGKHRRRASGSTGRRSNPRHIRCPKCGCSSWNGNRSEEHTSELQAL